MKKQALLKFALLGLISAIFVAFQNCSPAGNGGTTSGNPLRSDDTSASGAVASAVGGALSSSVGSTEVALQKLEHKQNLVSVLLSEAKASNSCPTFATAAGLGCSASGSTMWLDFSSCTFSGGVGLWNGTRSFVLSTGAATCGTFPTPGASASLIRQVVSSPGSSTPSSLTHSYPALGLTITVHDEDANLANFNSDTIATILNGGYGTKITMDSSGRRASVVIGQRIASPGLFNHSITGTLALTEGTGATSRLLNGQVTTYLNIVRVIAVSTFANVRHSNTCCIPDSGTITTTFSAGNLTPILGGADLVGKSETLTITACGQAKLHDANGVDSYVSLSRCD